MNKQQQQAILIDELKDTIDSLIQLTQDNSIECNQEVLNALKYVRTVQQTRFYDLGLINITEYIGV